MPSSAINVETEVPAQLTVEQLQAQVLAQAQLIEQLKRQLDWYRRQMFGSKSERLVLQDNPQQICLGEIVDQGSALAPPIARQSTWQGRVNHDGRGSRGSRSMLQLIV